LLPPRAAAGRSFTHGRGGNLTASDSSDAIAANAVVDDGVVVPNDVVVNDRGPAMHGESAVASQNMEAGGAIAEAIHRDVIVMMIAQAKIESEAKAVGVSIVTEAEAGPIIAGGGQGGPAAVAAGIAPAYPGRTPIGVRHPDPTEPRIVAPAAIVERSPTPRVIRIPVPSMIAPNPAAIVGIGTPPGIGNDDRRLPAKSVVIDLDPRAVRRE